MLNVSNDFKLAMKQPIKEIQAYVTSGNISITESDDLQSFKISCSSGLCKTAMKKLEASYIGEHNLLGQWVHVGYAVKLANGTFETLDYGSFLVSEITYTKDTGVTTITGYDKMINSMIAYTELNVTYPINLYDYTVALCTACNLELGNNAFTYNGDYPVNQELWSNIEGITYRDILVQIAQATGTTCIISNDDKVYFKSITTTNENLTYDNMFKLKLEPLYGEINSIVLSRTPVEDNVYKRDDASISTNGLTEFKIENNEIIDKDRDTAIDPIYEALHGISYYPFETTTEGLGWYEIGDEITIINDTNTEFKTAIFNISITLNGAIRETLKTTAETKTQTQYQYASTLAKQIKNTEIIVNKQEQYINSIVSDINGINDRFTNIRQDIEDVVTSVQNSGGSNLIKNSVMFAYDDNNAPTNWEISDTGKNKFDTRGSPASDTLTPNGYTYTVNNDGSITVDGTNAVGYVNLKYIVNLKAGTYTFSGCPEGGSYEGYSMLISAGGNTYWEFGDGVTITLNEDTQVTIYPIRIGSQTVTFNDTTFYPQIEKGTVKTAFSPYASGVIIIGSNAESLANGAVSGHAFKLLDKYASQRVSVATDNTYSFSTRIKKSATGTCYVKISNSFQSYTIELTNGQSAFWKEYELKNITPLENYFDIEFYGSSDSDAIFTDNMLNVGAYKTNWTQANGEIMNTQVNININGVLVKSSVYNGDYTVMSPLEFAGYCNINGTITKVFTLNKDTTIVKKLEAEDEFKMFPIKIVPITSGDIQGWAFVPCS